MKPVIAFYLCLFSLMLVVACTDKATEEKHARAYEARQKQRIETCESHGLKPDIKFFGEGYYVNGCLPPPHVKTEE